MTPRDAVCVEESCSGCGCNDVFENDLRARVTAGRRSRLKRLYSPQLLKSSVQKEDSALLLLLQVLLICDGRRRGCSSVGTFCYPVICSSTLPVYWCWLRWLGVWWLAAFLQVHPEQVASSSHKPAVRIIVSATFCKFNSKAIVDITHISHWHNEICDYTNAKSTIKSHCSV